MKRFVAFTIAVLIVACTGVEAGVIRGVVATGGKAVPAMKTLNAYAGRANALPGAATTQRGLITDAVVYVEALPGSVTSTLPPDASPPELTQINQSFEPRVLVIAAGATVTFPNRDPFYHNVFSLSPAKRFDLGKYAKGRSKGTRFTRPGLVKVYCDIHSNMEAFILVVPNAAFTQPSADGSFALPALPPGTYRLITWHPDFGESHTEVAVPESGDVDVRLLF